MLKANFVTVGYSAGAIGMIEAIRKYDKKNRILAITKEKYPAYGRPAIVDYAMGKINDNGIIYGGKEYTKIKKVDAKLGVEVTKIDANSHTIDLSDGEKVEYEKLLLNVGGKPISPPIPGKELEGVMHFFNLDEAKEMRKQVLEKGAKTAVVIGGGLIGLKATDALVHLGVKVFMIELAPTILSRALDPIASKLMFDCMQQKGVEIYTNTSVDQIIGDKKVKQVKLTNGKIIDTDLVYISIGVIPDTKLAEASNISVDKGIVIDRYMQTNFKDVYAAGDAVKGYNFITGEDMILAIWPIARKMGYYAGLNMLGKGIRYDGSIALNSLYFHGLYTISYGETNPQNSKDYEIMEKLFSDGKTYRKFIIKDNRLVGAVFVNDISRAGIVKGLIYENIPVSSFKDSLLRKDFSFIHVPKKYRDDVYIKPYKELEAK